jgi:hypothetical protein
VARGPVDELIACHAFRVARRVPAMPNTAKLLIQAAGKDSARLASDKP